MKKLLPAVLLLLTSGFAKAQDTTGMVAHWKLNGNCHDATEKGHDGIAHNIVIDTGKSGKDTTAYYFNGSDSSYISVAYKPDLNLKKYSICATLKIAGFYSGLCQGNVLLARGKPGTDGSYEIDFDDNPNDGADCYSMDTTKDIFVEWAGGSGLGPAITDWADTNTVSEGKWYSVVATYDDTTYNIYLNGQLVKSLFVGHRSMDSTTDSLGIGINLYEVATGFPYSFKGTMDDIRLYNRILDTSEITTYTNSTIGDTLINGISDGTSNGNGNGDTSHLAVTQVNVQPNAMHFYPNPANDILTVYFNQPIKNTELKILNQLGQEVRSVTMNGTGIKVPVKDLAPGMYFIRIMDGDKTITNRFMKE